MNKFILKSVICCFMTITTTVMAQNNGDKSVTDHPSVHYSEWMVKSEMSRTPHSYLLDFSSKPKWSYAVGIELEAMLDTYLCYGGEDILAYCQEYTDTMLSEDGDILTYRQEDFNLDQVRTGRFILRMNDEVKSNNKLFYAVQTLIRQLNVQPRTRDDGIYWHKKIYAGQVWLDGIFMGLPFRVLAAYINLIKAERKKMYEDAVRQVVATYNRTYDPNTGLNRHAWDETKEVFWADSITGQSSHCWGRAQGWFTMALVEILDVIPEKTRGREKLIKILKQTLDAILRWQDKDSGLWWQVMDCPDREGNYLESTCSCMFAYALMKSGQKGWVDSSYEEAGRKAYENILKRFVEKEPDGTISLTQCCSVAGLGPGINEKVKRVAPEVKEDRRRDGSFNYYISEPIRKNDPKGIGPFIWSSLCYEKSCKN